MTAIKLFRRQTEIVHSAFLETLDGVSEGQAWAVLPQGGSDYLHSDGSIHGITLHVATGRIMYGSMAFRNTEIRWRDMADRVAQFEPNWEKAIEYEKEAQDYWVNSWADLKDDDLEGEVPHFSGNLWPAWKIIQTILHHDSYHGGQIAMLRYAVAESKEPPPSVAEDIRKYCADLPSW